MTNVTCGLTAKKPGSAPCPTHIVKYRSGTTLLLYIAIAVAVNMLTVESDTGYFMTLSG